MATVENPVIFHGIALARDTRDSLLENLLFWIHVGKKTWDKQVAGRRCNCDFNYANSSLQ